MVLCCWILHKLFRKTENALNVSVERFQNQTGNTHKGQEARTTGPVKQNTYGLSYPETFLTALPRQTADEDLSKACYSSLSRTYQEGLPPYKLLGWPLLSTEVLKALLSKMCNPSVERHCAESPAVLVSILVHNGGTWERQCLWPKPMPKQMAVCRDENAKPFVD